LPRVLFSETGDLIKPDGDPVISTLPYILDCPDILETFIEIYNEDYVKKIKGRLLKDIKKLIESTRIFVTKVLNVINFDKYKFMKQSML